ncbi:hypothetical protein IAT38_005875 [Cryptococcus sp. DSM 104549]
MPIKTSTRPRVTVLGSGVVGLSTAWKLSETYDVTVVARDMPGDPDSLGWASPWAGAIWFGSDGAKPHEQKMQRASYARFMEIVDKHPESSIVKTDFYDYQDSEDKPNTQRFWYTFLPKFRYLKPEENRAKVGHCMFYESIVLNPHRYLPWLRDQCEANGVKFQRLHAVSLADAAAAAPCDLIVNATGNGSKFLMDVNDQGCRMVRGQVMLVQCDAKDVHIRHGPQYTYILPRGDGTAVLGGIKETSLEPAPQDWLRRDIHKRCHELLPEFIPEKFEDLQIIRDQVGFRPERKDSVRVEHQNLDGLTVVHAYGVSGGGYVYSHGVAAAVSELVDKTLSLEGKMERASL